MKPQIDIASSGKLGVDSRTGDVSGGEILNGFTPTQRDDLYGARGSIDDELETMRSP
jgi:hypothetical protein